MALIWQTNLIRYCLGAYNGCGNWYCLGNKLDYCQTPCPNIRAADPRVQVNVARSQSNTCGAHVTFSCPDCYTPSGSVSAECLPNSTWSHDTPTCSPVTCSAPFQINNGLVLCFQVMIVPLRLCEGIFVTGNNFRKSLNWIIIRR